MPLHRNPGYCPPETDIRDEAGNVTGHRRVRAVLFGGYDTRSREPQGWPSGGKGACNWRIGHPPHSHDIEFYEVIA